MKIEVISLTDEAIEKREYRNALVIRVNGVDQLSFIDGEPEDANLSRDFSDCFNIITLIEEAYNAGRHGEKLDIDIEEVEEI